MRNGDNATYGQDLSEEVPNFLSTYSPNHQHESHLIRSISNAHLRHKSVRVYR